MKESVSVADDFMSVRRWDYNIVHELDQTAMKPYQKEENCIPLLRLAKTDLPVPEPVDEIGAVDIFTVINLETTLRITILIMLA